MEVHFDPTVWLDIFGEDEEWPALFWSAFGLCIDPDHQEQRSSQREPPDAPNNPNTTAPGTFHRIDEEIERNFRAGHFEEVPKSKLARIFPLSAAEKKEDGLPTGKVRLCTNMSYPYGDSLNDSLVNPEFKFSSVTEALGLLFPGAWMMKSDFSAYYRSFEPLSCCWPSQGAKWRGKYYWDKRLPFGLRTAPSIAERVSQAIARYLRRKYHALVVQYLDDFLFIAKTQHEVRRFHLLWNFVITRLGFVENVEKREGPAREVKFLGFWINTQLMTVRLGQARISNTIMLVRQALQEPTVGRHKLESLVGLLQHASKVALAGSTFLSGLWALLGTMRTKRLPTTALSSEARTELSFWADMLPAWNGSRDLFDRKPRAPVTLAATDAASETGFGGFFDGLGFAGVWSECGTPDLHIAGKELLALYYAFILWAPLWRGKRVVVHCDNQNVIAWLESGHYRGSREDYPEVPMILKRLAAIRILLDIDLKLVYITSADNVLADALSRNLVAAYIEARSAFLEQLEGQPLSQEEVDQARTDLEMQTPYGQLAGWVADVLEELRIGAPRGAVLYHYH